MTIHLHLTVNGATKDWLPRLLAEPGITVTANEPAPHPVPVHLVRRLIDKVLPDAAYLLRLAADAGGRADCDTFRATRGDGHQLNTAAGNVTKHTNAAVRKKWWPAEFARILTPTGPGPNGWSKTTAYHMDTRLVGVFRAAFAETATAAGVAPIPSTTARTAARLSTLAREAGMPERLVAQFVDAACALHSAEIAAALRTRGESASADLVDPDPAAITAMWGDDADGAGR
ncbi:hypothetical protein ACGFYQ_34035 [Streptomyces sp. NPDC048258]|uniref:hypothetical protein n=1 Tax=Streptomyces sp. NPDC048258 TaxID=3365527 RepID=UPI00370FB086